MNMMTDHGISDVPLKLVVLVQGWWINASYEVDVKEGQGLGIDHGSSTIFLTDSSSPGYPQNSLFKKTHQKAISHCPLYVGCFPLNDFLLTRADALGVVRSQRAVTVTVSARSIGQV